MRVLEQTMLEALLMRRARRPHHSRQQPDSRIEHDQPRDLATRQHIIADRHLLELARRNDALVHPLEMAAHDHHPRTCGEPASHRLIEP